SLAVWIDRAIVEDFVEPGAQLVHGGQHIFIPLHPADIVGPRSSLHGEVRFLTLEVGDDPIGRARLPFRDTLENAALMDWPAAWQHGLAHTGLLDHLQIFGDVHGDNALGAEAREGLTETVGKLVHHHAAVLTVADLRDERRKRNPTDVLV